MKNLKQLVNKDNWINYLILAEEGELTNNAIANDIVFKIQNVIKLELENKIK